MATYLFLECAMFQLTEGLKRAKIQSDRRRLDFVAAPTLAVWPGQPPLLSPGIELVFGGSGGMREAAGA